MLSILISYLFIQNKSSCLSVRFTSLEGVTFLNTQKLTLIGQNVIGCLFINDDKYFKKNKSQIQILNFLAGSRNNTFVDLENVRIIHQDNLFLQENNHYYNISSLEFDLHSLFKSNKIFNSNNVQFNFINDVDQYEIMDNIFYNSTVCLINNNISSSIMIKNNYLMKDSNLTIIQPVTHLKMQDSFILNSNISFPFSSNYGEIEINKTYFYNDRENDSIFTINQQIDNNFYLMNILLEDSIVIGNFSYFFSSTKGSFSYEKSSKLEIHNYRYQIRIHNTTINHQNMLTESQFFNLQSISFFVNERVSNNKILSQLALIQEYNLDNPFIFPCSFKQCQSMNQYLVEYSPKVYMISSISTKEGKSIDFISMYIDNVLKTKQEPYQSFQILDSQRQILVFQDTNSKNLDLIKFSLQIVRGLNSGVYTIIIPYGKFALRNLRVRDKDSKISGILSLEELQFQSRYVLSEDYLLTLKVNYNLNQLEIILQNQQKELIKIEVEVQTCEQSEYLDLVENVCIQECQSYLSGFVCSSECQQGFYKNDLNGEIKCLKCPYGCQKCNNSCDCIKCYENLILNGTECLQFCKEGYYQIDNGCEPLLQEVLNYQYTNRACSRDHRKCNECYMSCLTCNGESEYECESCYSNYFQEYGRCIV